MDEFFLPIITFIVMLVILLVIKPWYKWIIALLIGVTSFYIWNNFIHVDVSFDYGGIAVAVLYLWAFGLAFLIGIIVGICRYYSRKKSRQKE